MKLLPVFLLVAAPFAAAPVYAATTVTQTMAVDGGSYYLKSDGSVWGLGIGPNPIVSSGVAALGSGSVEDVYLSSNNTVWVNQSFFISSGPIASNVVAIAPGFKNQHILFIKSDGSLWGAGLNDFGELGDGTTNNASTPEQIVSGGVIAAAAGGDYSLFIKSDGSLWGMGRNDYGQLGDGTTNEVNTPEQIVPSGVVAVSGGFIHSLFAKSDGSLWGMGDDEFGELGDGTYNSTNRPEQILSSGVVAVCCGLCHSLFIKSDGSLWAMGFDEYGELGDNGAAASGPRLCECTNQPVSIVASNVVAIAAGFYHSLFIKSDGSLWGMGEDSGLGFGFSTLFIAPVQIFPGPPAPLLMSRIVSQTNLLFNATCPYGGTYYLLASTNLVQPLSQWAAVLTNVVYVPGTNNFSVTLTNALSPTVQQFYVLQTQH
jgi:alpha-tubulin suppressor-like RCC1 family protein